MTPRARARRAHPRPPADRPTRVDDPARRGDRRRLRGRPGSRPYGTPLLRLRPRCDRATGRERCRSALPAVVDIAYAVKANPALAIVAHLGRLGLGADVASAGELATALRAGIGRIAHRHDRAGQARRRTRRRRASPGSEPSPSNRRASSPGSRRSRRTRAGRVPGHAPGRVTEDAAARERVRLVGDDGAGKFGMDAADLAPSARRRRGARRTSSCSGCTRSARRTCSTPTSLVAHVASTVRAARELARRSGIAAPAHRCGGGLGIPYARRRGTARPRPPRPGHRRDRLCDGPAIRS